MKTIPWLTPSNGVAAVTAPNVPLDYAAIAAAQQDDPELQRLRHGPTALRLKQFEVSGSPHKLWCDISCGQPRPYIPQGHRQPLFMYFHSQAHPGMKGTQRLIGKRAVWSAMRRDIQQWTRACLTW